MGIAFSLIMMVFRLLFMMIALSVRLMLLITRAIMQLAR